MPPARKNRSAAPAVVCMAHKRREKTKAHAKHVENIGQFLQDRGSTPRASTSIFLNSGFPQCGARSFFVPKSPANQHVAASKARDRDWTCDPRNAPGKPRLLSLFEPKSLAGPNAGTDIHLPQYQLIMPKRQSLRLFHPRDGFFGNPPLRLCNKEAGS